ncbi:MAG: MmgE/PrpD family protein [Chloroflexi bacterium]|nr:MmgE/PrpD family protein [Chloroflexota bacterium]
MASKTERIAAFVANAGFDRLPGDIIHETKRALLDCIGCAMAGISMQAGKIAAEFAIKLSGPAEASIIGTGKRVASTNAAFANATLINAQDFDPGSLAHDTPAVMAGALASVEAAEASGKDLILAIAIGHELATRLREAERPGLVTSQEQGFAFVTPAVAASCSKLLSLDVGQIRTAIGIASFIHPPNTVNRYFNTSPIWMTKYTVFGRIAEAGVTAALLAQMGFTADREALDGERCFWKTGDESNWDAESVSAGLGEIWRHRISYKVYPSNLPTAGAKDCFIQILEENSIQPEEIEKVTVRIAPVWQYRSMHDNRLRTEQDFIFNVRYQLSCAAHRIKPTRWLDAEVRQDPRLRAFMARVPFDIGCDEEAFVRAREKDPGANLMSAEIVARGKTFRKQTVYHRGLNREGYRLTDEELVAKFNDNVSKVLTVEVARRAVSAIFEVEKLAKMSELTGILVPR